MTRSESPWHAGERAVHDRVGERALADRITIAADVPDAAAEFLEQQTIVFVSALVGTDVWLTPLTGEPGFVEAVDPRQIEVAGRPPVGDPLAGVLRSPARVGMLAIEPATRRRMRLNGRATPTATGIRVALDQVYSNCPRFIQKRSPGGAAPPPDASAPVTTDLLTASQQRWVETADTFVIGTADRDGNADASHRGGSPGFVHVRDPAHLRFPDYAGNHMYMTLGNLEVQPSAGLLFVDWFTGATLQVTGMATVDFDVDRAAAEFPGAARVIDVVVRSVVETPARLPAAWSEPEYSPFNPPSA